MVAPYKGCAVCIAARYVLEQCMRGNKVAWGTRFVGEQGMWGNKVCGGLYISGSVKRISAIFYACDMLASKPVAIPSAIREQKFESESNSSSFGLDKNPHSTSTDGGARRSIK